MIYDNEIESIKFKNSIRLKLEDVNTKEILHEQKQPNTVTTVGKQLILDEMGGVNTQIMYGGVGTGAGNTSAGSVLLKTELARTGSIYTRAGATGTFSIFFNTSQANGTLTEVGFFGGTSSNININTGIMMNRIVLSPSVSKTATTTLTIDLDLSIT